MYVDEDTAQAVSDELMASIADTRFPCVGAKSVMARGSLKTVVCHSLESDLEDERIHSELVDWAEAFREDPDGLRSLALMFEGPQTLDEKGFEAAMWDRLQFLAEKDARSGEPYDRSVSSNPEDPDFSLSFGGSAFFVVGLHPHASRPARRVPRPTLIFNLHEQFERLRADGRYERMRDKIMSRDLAYSGSVNPMVARYGESSEARQYSGRVVGDDWRCPFHDPRSA